MSKKPEGREANHVVMRGENKVAEKEEEEEDKESLLYKLTHFTCSTEIVITHAL